MLKNPPTVAGYASVVGKREHEGPLREYFDLHDSTEKFGMDTWEKAESEMQRLSLNLALAKARLCGQELGAIFAGDLMNQCIGSSYAAECAHRPFFGLYGACSTFAEGSVLASLLLDSGAFSRCAVLASSHFCTAQRQFRYPLEYGCQRTPTSQRTATAAGALILASEGNGPYIREVLPGTIVDMGITDINNMGAAMAPAAYDTLTKYFGETGKKPEDFDLILTGDLGREGHGIICDFMKSAGYDMADVYNDCGLMLYDVDGQDMHSGGSGCGCSAATVAGYIMKRFEKKELCNVLYIATGALMSPASLQQGRSIPGIAHLVRISAERGE
ncbi:MAG: stage V sporulation protein AD [Clostridia bacterium]|nr:stage V sporulation protein AD [Clostridia bacterium]